MNKLLRWSALALFILLAASLVFGSLVPLASAVATTTLFPNGEGTYTSWVGGESDIDETGTVSCSSSDSINEDNTGDRESVLIDLSSIPDGSTITSVDVTVSYTDASGAGSDGTFKTFARLNSTNVDASADLTASGSQSNPCNHTDTQTIDVSDTVKSVSTTLEVGVLKTGTDTSNVWVGALRASVTYILVMPQTITVTTNAPASATYGDTFPVAATASSGLTVAITTTGGCSIDAGTVTMTSGTASCVVKYNQVGNGTYSAAPEVTQTVTADKAALTITPDDTSKTYGDTVTFAGTEFTTGDLVSGDSVTSVTLSSSGAAANAAVSGSPYDITGSDAVGTGLSNYTITYDTGTLTVDQKDVSVTATGVNKEYDTTTDADVIPFVDGALEGADVDVSYVAEFTDPNVGTDITVNVTDLSLTGDDAGNYNLTNTTTSTDADITEASATVTLDEEQDLTVTYDGSSKPLTFSTTPEGLELSVTYDGDTDAPTNAGEYTVIATVTDSNYAGSEEVTLTIEKADAEIEVSGYEVTYDGESHTATGSAMGVGEEGELEGLDLSDTTHTNAGSYEDEWTFTDSTGNYNDASGSVESLIAKAEADIEIDGYNVTYDGESHTATGSATGVGGEEDVLSGLDLSDTTHTEIGVYAGDVWTFTDVTGNYNYASGSVDNTISDPTLTHTLTYTAGANGSIGGTATQTVDDGATGSAVSAIADSGYTFLNWSDGSIMNPRIDSNVTGDVSVNANFSKLGSGGGGRSFTGGTRAAQAPGQVLGASTSTPPVGQVGETTFVFTKNLWYRMPRNTDVSELQKFLVGKGYSIPNGISTWFGTETLAAVKAFQKDNGVNPTGFVGPLTRALLNQAN